MRSLVRACAAVVATATIATLTLGGLATLAHAEDQSVDITPTTEAPAPPTTEAAPPVTDPAPPPPPEPLETQGTDDVGAQASSELRIVLDTVPNLQQNFTYSVSPGTSFTLDDDNGAPGGGTGVFSSVKKLNVPQLESRVVTQSAVPGFTLAAINCSGPGAVADLANRRVTFFASFPGPGNATCTFVNKQNGQLVIIQDTIPNGLQDFDYDATGMNLPADFDLDDDGGVAGQSDMLFNTRVAAAVPDVGNRTVTQSAVSGYELVSITCFGGGFTVDVPNRKVTVNITPGRQVSCEFDNVRRGSITIVEDSKPDSAQNYGYSGGLGGFSLDDDLDATLPSTKTFGNLSANDKNYAITQGVVAGSVIESITCNTSENVNLALRKVTVHLTPGENVTCKFTNGRPQPDNIVANGNGSAPVGNNVYSDPAGAQVKVRDVTNGNKVRFKVPVCNDAGIADAFTLQGQVNGAGGYKVKYKKANGVDITDPVRNGTFNTGVIAAGACKVYFIQIRANTAAFNTFKNANLRSRSNLLATAVDVVLARAHRV